MNRRFEIFVHQGSLQNLEHMELPAHEVLQSLQTLLSSSQIAVPASNVATLPKNMNSLGVSSSHLTDGCHGLSAPTPLEGDPANGPPTPTHSERLEADFRRGNSTIRSDLVCKEHFFFNLLFWSASVQKYFNGRNQF